MGAPMAQKPLPAIPRHPNTSPSLTTLTTDAQAHLSDFIRHILSESAHTCFPGGEREAWAQAIELGLAELGDSISRGGWFTGIKRGRKAQKARRDARLEEVEKEKERAKKEQEDLGKGKAKRKGPQGPDEPAEVNEPEGRGFFVMNRSPHTRNVNSALALDHIRELISRPSLPTPKPSAKHVLLSVAPLGSLIALPVEASGLNVVPYDIACVFRSGVFSLPEADVQDEGHSNVVLYGIDEWDSEYP
jgi:1-phosphatidylinositol-3-phosphate 5-kinase